MKSKGLISVLTFLRKSRDILFIKELKSKNYVFGDNSAFYACQMFLNIFVIKTLTQYKESIKEDRWGV